MPPEVLLGRRVGRIKRKIVIALVLVLVTVPRRTASSSSSTPQRRARSAGRAGRGRCTQAGAADLRRAAPDRHRDPGHRPIAHRRDGRRRGLGQPTSLRSQASAPPRVQITGITVVLSGIGGPTDDCAAARRRAAWTRPGRSTSARSR